MHEIEKETMEEIQLRVGQYADNSMYETYQETAAQMNSRDTALVRHETYNIEKSTLLNIHPLSSACEPMHVNGSNFCHIDKILIKILQHTIDTSSTIHAYFEELLDDLSFHIEEVLAESETRRKSIKEKRAHIIAMTGRYDGGDIDAQFEDVGVTPYPQVYSISLD
jgi:hypothetical protein